MTLPYPPPWQDKATLCEHICQGDRTVDAWVKLGLLPAPRLIRGKLMWRWTEVERYLDRAGQDAPASAPSEAQQQEDIRVATQRALRG